jgi:hypothetical protein
MGIGSLRIGVRTLFTLRQRSAAIFYTLIESAKLGGYRAAD